MTISRAFTTLAEREPERPAVTIGDTTLTRADLERRSNALAHRFLDLGVGHDDFVTIFGGNTVDMVLATVATWKAGAIPQPLSPRLPRAEAEAIVQRVRPALVIDGELPSVDGANTEPPPDAAASTWKAPTSSGSTGVPKVILASASAHVDPDGRVAAFIPRQARQLVAGPLFHAAPFVYAMRGLMTGHTLVVMPGFDAQEWLRLVEQHRISWSMLVPTMMSRILALGPDALERTDVCSIESVLHIGAVCPPHVKRGWIDWLGPERVVEVYSGTESNGLTMIRGDEWRAHQGSVGRPIGGTTLRIVDEDRHELPSGRRGLVEMTRPGAATYRYLGREQPPADAWHTLGDVGHVDQDGYLFIDDRIDDAITTGGTTVWPASVESVLERHPLVRSCTVVGVPDDDLGERIRAVVDVADAADVSVTVAAFEAWAADAFSRETRPREWVVVREPVRDDTGKVRRSRWRN